MDAEFNWNTSHDIAFEASKALVCREVTVAYFVPGADTVFQVDTSGRGLGAVLLQGAKPIAFSSKSLSQCGKRYLNIEREIQPSLFGCERFHTYVYGTRFTVESDHKPLEMIHLKNRAAAPQRRQRMLLRFQPYAILLRYHHGKELALADTMSRQPCADGKKIELDVHITFVQLPTYKLQTLRLETRADSGLQSLITVITNGWPERQCLLPAPLRPYRSY